MDALLLNSGVSNGVQSDFYSLEANLVILIFNERALDLRNCRRFTPFFGLFPRARGGASSLPRASWFASSYVGREPSDSLCEDRETDDSLRED